jgi:site-specific recombinase XerD
MQAAVLPFQLPKVGKPKPTHPIDSYLLRLSESSRRGMRIALNNVVEIASGERVDTYEFDWATLGYADTIRIREQVAKRFSLHTANYHLCALRGVLRECWRLELMSHAEYASAVDFGQIRGYHSDAGRVLSLEELVKLFSACQKDKSAAGVRDAAILAILYGCGLRRAELVGLNGAAYSNGVLTVMGKGNRFRLAHVVNEAREFLEDWLAYRQAGNEPIFVSINKAGKLGTARLTTQSIYRILNRRASEAGIEPLSPHDIRRTTATHLLDKGVDLATVQRMLGHRQLSTTIIYDKRGEKAKKQAAEVLSLPICSG